MQLEMESKQLTNSFPERKRFSERNRIIKKDSVECITDKKKDEIDFDSKTEIEKLKAFDLTLEYGPCIGITRMERWERAEKHGMNPPPNIKEIIKRHENDDVFKQSLWNAYSSLN